MYILCNCVVVVARYFLDKDDLQFASITARRVLLPQVAEVAQPQMEVGEPNLI